MKVKIWIKNAVTDLTYGKICQYTFEAYSDLQSRAIFRAWLFQTKHYWYLIFNDTSVTVGDFSLSEESAQKIAERIMQDNVR